MKKYIFGALALAASLSMSSCDDFLEVKPSGIVDEELAFSEPDAMVTAAYAALGADWYTYPFNLWPYGSLASDDALKGGGDTGDTEYHAVEMWSTLSSTNPGGHMDELWYHLYVSISRCNRAIMAVRDQGDEKLGAELAKVRMGEARFLRGHFYFKLIQLFNQVPYIDEVCLENAAQEQTRNDEFTHEQLMEKVIADFQAAYEALPVTQPEIARVNKAAAAAMLAKCYLNKAYGNGYEQNTGYSHINTADLKKVIEYTDFVISTGKYDYEADYGDIFMQENKNGVESIFAVQHSNYEDDNTKFGRSNWSNMLNGCHGMWSKGWDFHKPSQNLVNAFKVDKDGFPMFKDYEKEHNVYPENGVEKDQKWDPRLFHTVGIPSFPYKYESAYTMTKDNARCPSSYGYYTSLKEVPQRSKGESYTESTWQGFAMNDYVVRYSEMMLWRAEAMIETGDIPGGIAIINRIRKRATESVWKYIGYAFNQVSILGQYSDNVSLDDARMYLRWEKRLEMGMEAERFFDLRRWGIASETMNAYFAAEQNSNYDGMDYAGYYAGAHFQAGKNEYWPIPYQQLFYVPGLYVQNAGY